MHLALIAALLLTADATAYMPGDSSPEGNVQSTMGRKKVFEAIREGTDPDAGPLQVGFLGYFRRPHEARIAIVLGEEHPGSEGATIVDLRVIGAALTTGFKR